MARVLLAIGSHGRSSACESTKKRARIARVELDPLKDDPNHVKVERVADGKKWQSDAADCDSLIVLGSDADERARALKARACEVIEEEEVAAEHYVTRHPGHKDCRETPFNVEGAVSAKGKDGTTRIWLGLRAPLLPPPPGSGQALLL